jgi:hypothetical protein
MSLSFAWCDIQDGEGGSESICRVGGEIVVLGKEELLMLAQLWKSWAWDCDSLSEKEEELANDEISGPSLVKLKSPNAFNVEDDVEWLSSTSLSLLSLELFCNMLSNVEAILLVCWSWFSRKEVPCLLVAGALGRCLPTMLP